MSNFQPKNMWPNLRLIYWLDFVKYSKVGKMYTQHVVNFPEIAHPMSQLEKHYTLCSKFQIREQYETISMVAFTHSFQQLLYCFTNLWEISHNNLQNIIFIVTRSFTIFTEVPSTVLKPKKKWKSCGVWSRRYSQCRSSTAPFFTMCYCDRVLPHRSLLHFQMLSTQCAALHMDKHLVKLWCAMPSCLKI